MALSDPRIFYSIHSFSPFNVSTGEFYGTTRVMGSSSFALSGELSVLNGGSNRYPWAVEDGIITSELSLVGREYPDFLFELFLGKQPTANSAEASGSVTSLTNKSGTSVQDATTGIASIAATSGSEADLKFARYVIKAVDATTVDVYASSNVDFARGTDLTFQNDLLKITASPLTVPSTGGTVDVPSAGITLTGGSGTVAFTADDTATFTVRPINSSSMDVSIGGLNDVFPTFGAVLVGQQRGNGSMVEITVHSLKALGMPLNFNPQEFSEWEVTAQAFYSSTAGGVFDVRTITI